MSRDLKNTIFILIVSCLTFIPFIGNVHLFDWDEINFAESAREMLETGDYLTVQIFYEPFWEKPPLFIWLQAFSMNVFGVNEFGARFPNAIAGIITLLVLYFNGKKIVNEKFGLIWAMCYGISLLPFFYFKSGIIDPWFNLFIFLGVACYVYAQKEERQKNKFKNIIFSAVFLGLAVLTKGPVAILVFGLMAFILLLLERFRLHLKTRHVLVFLLVFLFTGGFWFLIQILYGNWQTVVDFFVYQIRLFKQKDAGHGGIPFYHFIVLFFGVFPASLFAILAHIKGRRFDNNVNYFRKVMIVLLWVVLILFSIVKTKIVHYSSLCYFPITFLATYSVYSILYKQQKIPKWIAWLQIVSVTIIGLAVVVLPLFDRLKNWFVETGKITHSFTVGNLQANPGWSGFESLIGVILILGVIVGFIAIKKKNPVFGFQVMSIASALFIFLAMLFITPGVEKYSQNSAIEFFKANQNKDVYVQTFYKSYAKLFYTRQKPMADNHPFIQYWKKNKEVFGDDKEGAFTTWLATEPIDKPAWFVIRLDKKKGVLAKFKEVKVVKEINGYVFCKRMPQRKNRVNSIE